MRFRSYKPRKSVCGNKDPETDGLKKGTGTQVTSIVELIKETIEI